MTNADESFRSGRFTGSRVGPCPSLGSAVVIALAILLGLAAAPRAQAFVVISATVTAENGSPESGIPVGDEVTIEIVLSNQDAQQGLHALAEGYDPSILGFTTGAAVESFFSTLCVPSVACFGGISNFRAGESGPFSGPAENSPGVVEFASGLSGTPVSNSGAADLGLNGETIESGDVHASLTFTALSPGWTTIVLVENAYCYENACPAIYPQFGSASIGILVTPEPSSALMLGVGLAALCATSRRRRTVPASSPV